MSVDELIKFAYKDVASSCPVFRHKHWIIPMYLLISFHYVRYYQPVLICGSAYNDLIAAV